MAPSRGPSSGPSKGIDAATRQRRLKALRARLPANEKLLVLQKIPHGYTLVRRGDVYVTRHCRAETHAAKQAVYQIHHATTCVLFGIACPSEIVAAVQARALQTADSRAAAVAARDQRDATLTQAAIQRLYPRMPVAHADAMRAHAFRKGSRRVGRAKTHLSEDERVRRAVTAYARHRFTEYDRILDAEIAAGHKGIAGAKERARARIRGGLRNVLEGWEGKQEKEKKEKEEEASNGVGEDVKRKKSIMKVRGTPVMDGKLNDIKRQRKRNLSQKGSHVRPKGRVTK